MLNQLGKEALSYNSDQLEDAIARLMDSIPPNGSIDVIVSPMVLLREVALTSQEVNLKRRLGFNITPDYRNSKINYTSTGAIL